jgi:hypothetical protein
MGMLNKDNGEVKLTKKSKFLKESKPVAVINWAFGLIWKGLSFPEGYLAKHAGKCGRCGKMLTTPDSLERGIGPECWSLMGLK